MSFYDVVSSIIDTADTWAWYVAFVFIVGFGIYATCRSKCVQINRLGEACKVAFTGIREKKGKHVISSFQAFCVSMGARIGVGNIAGVATAIVMGGPGAVFWMWIFALIGAATSFVENTIGQIYKERKGDGFFHGGPAYYVKNGLGKPKFAIFMAIMIIVTYGLCFIGVQANQASASLQTAFSGAFGDASITVGVGDVSVLSLIIAVVLAVLSAAIVFGGIRRVARVSTWLVPAMAILWMLLAIILVLVNFTQVSAVIETIFSYAFGAQAFVGGGIGAMIMWGLKRGVFSNEAGIGSIPNVSSSAHVKHPVKQGLMQSLGVLIDTIVVCSATAFVVIMYTNVAYPAYDFAAQGVASSLAGAPLVAEALSASFLGAAAPYILAAFLLVFAFSSLISYYSMSESNVRFITEKKGAIVFLRIIIVVMVFASALWSMTFAWNLADLFQALMGIFNIGIIVFLAKHAWSALSDYFNQKADGVDEPVFNPKVLTSQKGVTCWPPKDDEGKDNEGMK
ncbi:MAG TPA: alanine/glycine:cation symporter family protein [Methanocorpusculum sp.]|nr:alanine/glycine:cation symporter family protein [Methanocorpusculum sp.]